jgi:hypothetical protein
MLNRYIIQPYEVGSKQAKSLALIIPAEVRKAKVNTSTVFILNIDETTKRITLQKINEIIEKSENTMVPAEESFFMITPIAITISNKGYY